MVGKSKVKPNRGHSWMAFEECLECWEGLWAGVLGRDRNRDDIAGVNRKGIGSGWFVGLKEVGHGM